MHFAAFAPVPMVPGFLALSGFLVLQSWQRSTPAQFWMKRARRILPALCVSFALVALLLGSGALGDAMLTWLSAGNLGQLHGNAPLWSLGWEELFYFSLFPLSLIGAFTHRRRLLFVSLGLSIYAFLAYTPDFSGPWSQGQLPLAFTLGNMAYVWRDRLVPVAMRYGWHLLIIGISLRYVEYSVSHRLAADNLLVWLITVSGVLGVGLSKQSNAKPLPDFSFGTYVYHWPLLVFATEGLGLTGWALYPAVLGPVVLLAALSWRFVEKPALGWKPRPKPVRPSLQESLA